MSQIVKKGRGVVVRNIINDARNFMKGDLLHQALEKYLEALSATPKKESFKKISSQIYKEMGDIYDKLGDLDQAMCIYEKAVSMYPDNKNLLYYQFLINEKKRNVYELGEEAYHVISLGSDCLARKIPTKYGLKKRKVQGELSCPF